MKTTDKKISTDLVEVITNELQKNKFVKFGVISTVGVAILFAGGLLFKALDFSIGNFKNLKETLNR